MVRIAASLAAAFVLAAPTVLAIPVPGNVGLATRELPESVDLLEREFDEVYDLDAREPILGFGKKSVGTAPHPKGHGLYRAKPLSERDEVEDIDFVAAREYVIEKLDELVARDEVEVEELAAREPTIGEWFKNLGAKIKNAGQTALNKIKGVFHRKKKDTKKETTEASEEPSARDFDDDLEDFIARDFEDVEELAVREPGIGEWFKNLGAKIKNAGQTALNKIKGVFHRKKKDNKETTEVTEEPAAREVDEELMDLFDREIDLE
jgi:uncharacterized spore protein YtfJ